MKNIYELSTKEKDKYRDEFNKLESTKKINKKRFISLVVLFFGGLVVCILECLIEDGNKFLENFDDIAIFFTAITFLEFSFYEVYSRISFIRWLKIKYNIEY